LLDGYRAIGVRTSRETTLHSRNGTNFNKRYPCLIEAYPDLPSDTVIDDEVDYSTSEPKLREYDTLFSQGES